MVLRRLKREQGWSLRELLKWDFSGDAILTAPGMSPGCDSGLSG